MQQSLIMAGMLAATLALTACNADRTPADQPSAAGSSASASAIDNVVDRAMDHAGAEMRTRNISISGHKGASGLARAQITPQGDLLIEGKAVTITADQRALLLDYRARVEDIATQGMAIGKEGAALGMHAAAEALKGAFSGQSEAQIQQHVEAQTAGIKQSALALCERLPGLLAAQQKLAAALPAFAPYATMTENDITNCRNGARDDSHS